MGTRPHRQLVRERLSRAFATRLRTYRSTAVGWRLAAPAVFVAAGALFITSAVSSGGTDLRGGRIADLAGLAAAESRELEELRAEQAALVEEVDRLTERLTETNPSSAQERAKELRTPAGLQPVAGPAVTVTLSDAPEAIQDTADTPVNNLVVHQQDIQAVANALWAGGAEAMTIQDQRVVSTTGIRCVGNTVVLHDVTYAPPYVITAVGPTSAMLDSLNNSPYIGYYLEAVAAFELGWEVEVESNVQLPGYTGSTALSYARAAGTSTVSAADET